MSTSSLTDRVLDILANGPIVAIDVWDALGDASLTMSDVASELYALREEGRADRAPDGRYSLAAQTVAS